MIPHRAEIDPRHRLTDTEAVRRVLALMNGVGAHSHELRSEGYSGNPSQRIRELRDLGFVIETQREAHGKRPGIRIFYRGTRAGVDAGHSDSFDPDTNEVGVHSGTPPEPVADTPPSDPAAATGKLFEVPRGVPPHDREAA